MSIQSLFNQSFKVQDRTDELLASTAISASHTLTRSAGQTCCFLVTIAGADTSGSIDLIGNVAGTSTTETLSFSGAGSRQTVNQFDNGQLTALEPTGLTGTLVVEAVSPDGQPIVQHVDITGAFPCRIADMGKSAPGSRLLVQTAGMDERGTHILYMLPLTTSLTGGERLINTDDSTEVYLMAGAPAERRQVGSAVHHWEIPLITEDA